jgi:hypothetical protein
MPPATYGFTRYSRYLASEARCTYFEWIAAEQQAWREETGRLAEAAADAAFDDWLADRWREKPSAVEPIETV